MGEIARAYMVLGIEHILGGFDHLLFVLRCCSWSASTPAGADDHRVHACAQPDAGVERARLADAASPPVEATIALSIMLVAGEALNKRETLSRRWPALVAFLFGLVHGLGFAGALSEIGLPQNTVFCAADVQYGCGARAADGGDSGVGRVEAGAQAAVRGVQPRSAALRHRFAGGILDFAARRRGVQLGRVLERRKQLLNGLSAVGIVAVLSAYLVHHSRESQPRTPSWPMFRKPRRWRRPGHPSMPASTGAYRAPSHN